MQRVRSDRLGGRHARRAEKVAGAKAADLLIVVPDPAVEAVG
ncbi:UNVERIFIED_CONTAM: hypothetical protein RKD50_009124 [Streptomyces canus]